MRIGLNNIKMLEEMKWWDWHNDLVKEASQILMNDGPDNVKLLYEFWQTRVK